MRISDWSSYVCSSDLPAKWLYRDTVEELLKYTDLREGPSGLPRTTYCFRHTYATLRLSAGVDVYILAQQMGTSVKMIEQHYGHVNTIRSEERRGGKRGVRTCRSRGTPVN